MGADDRPARPLALEGAADPGRFVEAVGERMALLGTEGGSFELWMWPVCIARGLSVAWSAAPTGERRVAVLPGGVAFRTAVEGGAVSEEVFVCQESRALLWAVRSAAPTELECTLSFLPCLDPQWPAGLGAKLSLLDEGAGTFTVSEELGRFAACFGATESVRWDANARDHGLPRTPVAASIRLAPGESAAFVVAGAELPPRPLSEEARLGLGQAACGTSRAEQVIAEARALFADVVRDPASRARANEERWGAFLASTADVQTGRDDLDLAFRWSKVAIERAWVEVDGVGRGLVAGLAPSRGGDRPGYGWFFDGDALVASRAMLAYGDARGPLEALRFATSHQRADGKMMHELTLSARLCDWLGDFPYAYYKGINSADFVLTLERFVRWTGDLEAARELWQPALRALRWCAGCADERGRIENRKAGIAAVEAGPLSDRILSEVFLQGAWVGALRGALYLAGVLGDDEARAWLEADLARAARGFETFWSEELGRYGFAHLEDGERCDDLTAYLGYPLALGVGDPDRARRSARALASPELLAASGARMFATTASVYDPDHYNTGSVFPYLTNFVVQALHRHGLHAEGSALFLALAAQVGRNGRGLLEEHFTGDDRIPERGVPHQIFSSSTIVEGVVSGLLGLEPSAVEREVELRPALPFPLERLSLEGLAIGAARVDLRLERTGDGVRVRARSTDSALTWSLAGSPTRSGAEVTFDVRP